jgi:hypothetical protein
MLKKLIAALYILSIANSYAATSPNSFITPQTPNRGFAVLSSSVSVGTYVILYTAGTNGSRCYSITITSTDSVAHNVGLQIQNSGSIVYQLSVSVNPYAGEPPVSGGGPTIPFISPSLTAGLPVDQYGNQYLQLVAGDTIRVATTYTAVSSGLFMNVYAICSDF